MDELHGRWIESVNGLTTGGFELITYKIVIEKKIIVVYNPMRGRM